MAWKELFEADSVQGLQDVVPSMSDLPNGMHGRFEIHGFGLGLLADAPGQELLWNSYLNGLGVHVNDVFGENSNVAVVDWTVDQSLAQGLSQSVTVVPVLLVIAALIALLLALGWLVTKIKGLVEVIVETVKDFWPLILAGLGLATVMVLRRKR